MIYWFIDSFYKYFSYFTFIVMSFYNFNLTYMTSCLSYNNFCFSLSK
nr:MAG TPA: hypothetical protein [Bacteriophage sp.]